VRNPEKLDPTSMIFSARCLQLAARKMSEDTSEGIADTGDGTLLFCGNLQGQVILLSLALEIALKALISEESGKVCRTHDLLTLFRHLKPDTQRLLEEHFDAGRPGYDPINVAVGVWEWESLPNVLSRNRDAHTEWRFFYEKLDRMKSGVFESSELNRVLTLIIEACG